MEGRNDKCSSDRLVRHTHLRIMILLLFSKLRGVLSLRVLPGHFLHIVLF